MTPKKISTRHSQQRHSRNGGNRPREDWRDTGHGRPKCGDREQRSNAHLRIAIYDAANGALYLTIPQLGRLLGIAEQTVRNQMSRGVFPLGSIKLGRRRLFPIEDVVAFAGQGPT